MPKNRIQINNEHQKLHTLYGMAFDKAFFIDQKEQTKKDCLNTSQPLNKKMHNRVLSLNAKGGVSLPHTHILPSTQMALMRIAILPTIQQTDCESDPGRQ